MGINEVRVRLHTAANLYWGGQNFAQCHAQDVNAILADHARLQADAARYQWLKSGGSPAVGYLGMMNSSSGWDAAIDAAKAVQP